MHVDDHAPQGCAEGAAGVCTPTLLALREALRLPVALFRLWIRAQDTLVLPIATLATEHIVQVLPCSCDTVVLFCVPTEKLK